MCILFPDYRKELRGQLKSEVEQTKLCYTVAFATQAGAQNNKTYTTTKGVYIELKRLENGNLNLGKVCNSQLSDSKQVRQESNN